MSGLTDKDKQAVKELLSGEKRTVFYKELSDDGKKEYQRATTTMMDKAQAEMREELARIGGTTWDVVAYSIYKGDVMTITEFITFINKWKNKAGWTRVCQDLILKPCRIDEVLEKSDLNKLKEQLAKKQAQVLEIEKIQDLYGSEDDRETAVAE